VNDTQVGIVQDSGNANQASPSTRDNSNILPRILALLSLSVMGIVQVGDGNPQWLDPGSWSILSTGHRHINLLGTLKAAFNVIIYFRSPLAKVGPIIRSIGKAMFDCSLSAPDDAGTRS